MVATVGNDVGQCLQYAFPNMECEAMPTEGTKRGMVLTVGDDVWGAVFRIQCAFPNMEGVAMLNEK